MKLLILSKHYGRISGASVATCEFLRRWAPNVEWVDVVCARDWYRQNEVPVANNIHVHPLRSFNPWSIYQTSRKLSDEESVLYSPDDYGIFAKAAGLPYVITNHSNWPWALRAGIRYFLVGLYHTPLYAINFWAADAIINYSYFGERWSQRFNKNTHLIRNGISLKKHGKNPDLSHPNIMTCGHMDSRKGSLLIQIIEHLRDISANWHLYIVGDVTYRPLKRYVDGGQIVCFGHVDNPGDYMQECDVFLLASRMENLSLAVTEAMHLRKPVVAFDVGGLGEIVSEETGALIPRFDIGQMARALNHLLQNEIARSERGKAAREAVKEFDWDLSAERYLTVFEQVLRRDHKQMTDTGEPYSAS